MQDMGLDLGDQALTRSRSWRWFTLRVSALLTRPVSYDPAGHLVFANRTQAAVFSAENGTTNQATA